jgi:hypothetical protein
MSALSRRDWPIVAARETNVPARRGHGGSTLRQCGRRPYWSLTVTGTTCLHRLYSEFGETCCSLCRALLRRHIRICAHSTRPCLVIDEAQVVMHEAHQPDLFRNLADADVLTGEDLAEIHLATSHADASALRAIAAKQEETRPLLMRARSNSRPHASRAPAMAPRAWRNSVRDNVLSIARSLRLFIHQSAVPIRALQTRQSILPHRLGAQVAAVSTPPQSHPWSSCPG